MKKIRKIRILDLCDL